MRLTRTFARKIETENHCSEGGVRPTPVLGFCGLWGLFSPAWPHKEFWVVFFFWLFPLCRQFGWCNFLLGFQIPWSGGGETEAFAPKGGKEEIVLWWPAQGRYPSHFSRGAHVFVKICQACAAPWYMGRVDYLPSIPLSLRKLKPHGRKASATSSIGWKWPFFAKDATEITRKLFFTWFLCLFVFLHFQAFDEPAFVLGESLVLEGLVSTLW